MCDGARSPARSVASSISGDRDGSSVLWPALSIISIVGVIGLGDPQHFYLMQAVIAGVSGLITGALTTPFTAGVDSLLYVDQRIRREGFDVQLIAAAQADATQDRPGAAARS